MKLLLTDFGKQVAPVNEKQAALDDDKQHAVGDDSIEAIAKEKLNTRHDNGHQVQFCQSSKTKKLVLSDLSD